MKIGELDYRSIWLKLHQSSGMSAYNTTIKRGSIYAVLLLVHQVYMSGDM